MSLRSQVLAALAQVADEQNRPLTPLTDDLPLLHCGLDSLCLAVVVARLEDALNVDPFSTNEDRGFPVTVGDFVRFYDEAVDASRRGRCRTAVPNDSPMQWGNVVNE